MKKIVIMLSFTACLISLIYALGSKSLVFNKNEYDYGEIGQNERAKAFIYYTNKLQKEITIKKIRTSCGCTAAKPSKYVLKPGESGYVEITYRSGKGKGHVKKSISFETLALLAICS